jgi:hypothetical protein
MVLKSGFRCLSSQITSILFGSSFGGDVIVTGAKVGCGGSGFLDSGIS